MTEEAWLTIMRLRYANPEDPLREIASLIRQGCTEPRFLNLLADHIDPDVKATPFGTKLVLKRAAGRGGPKGEGNPELECFLELHIDIFPDHKAEAVKAEAARRFGVSASTCKAALKFKRERRRRDPELFEMIKASSQLLRDGGDPDYQPISNWTR